MNLYAFSIHGSIAAGTRVRFSQYEKSLADSGFKLRLNYLIGDSYLLSKYNNISYSFYKIFRSYLSRMLFILSLRNGNLKIINGELFPYVPFFIEKYFLGNYIYDFDDAFYLKYEKKGTIAKFFLNSKIEKIIRKSTAVFAGSQVLFDYARKYHDHVYLIPSVVNTDIYKPKNNIVRNFSKRFTIGWLGSPSNSMYLKVLIEPLALLAKKYEISLIVIGGFSPPIVGCDVINLDWNYDLEVDLINQFDVGVMPLFNDKWAAGKCAYKLIQYMSCGLPVIGSNVGANSDVVNSSVGFLCDNKLEWYVATEKLINDSELRVAMGVSARKHVINNYSLNSNFPKILNSIKKHYVYQ